MSLLSSTIVRYVDSLAIAGEKITTIFMYVPNLVLLFLLVIQTRLTPPLMKDHEVKIATSLTTSIYMTEAQAAILAVAQLAVEVGVPLGMRFETLTIERAGPGGKRTEAQLVITLDELTTAMELDSLLVKGRFIFVDMEEMGNVEFAATFVDSEWEITDFHFADFTKENIRWIRDHDERRERLFDMLGTLMRVTAQMTQWFKGIQAPKD